MSKLSKFLIRTSISRYIIFSLLFVLVHSTAIAQKKFSVQDSAKAGRNMYGDLLNDDSQYNKKSPVWKPFIEVIAINNATWMTDRYLFNEPFSVINKETWNNNLHGHWEWDADRFGINFIGHPYSGTMYFNAARSQGYNFWQSFPFAVEGSLMWEYFGENTKPSYNDIINTPVNGVFFGEILYRLSSNILDDRTFGWQRTWREVVAGIVNPVRGVNRMLQGKTWRLAPQEVYQKEPINITFFAGVHNRNENNGYFAGKTLPLFSFQFDYGNPFEDRYRKPYDLFRLRTGLRFGDGRKILDQATGYGILVGKNIKKEKPAVLLGAFQYYDYWDNNSFELAAIAFGGGVLSRWELPIGNSNLFLNFHLGLVPLAGTSQSPDTASQVRDYNFGNGATGQVEITANLLNRVTARISGYYYYLHQSVNGVANTFVGVLQPNIYVRLFDDVSIGYEQALYYNDKFFTGAFSNTHRKSKEQKIFILFYLEDSKRSGKYH